MNSESKTCQSCKAQFTIELEDFDFYKKIDVPPPTRCPDCRFRRRMTWRNDWHLFKKKDALTGQEIFSFFPEESPVKIYDREYWISDAWDPMTYGKEYDWNKPFLQQFRELLHTVPLPAHSMVNVVNCSYCTNANNIKNCYLVRGSSRTEDSAYLIWDRESKNSFDSHMTNACELSYGNVNCVQCYKTFFSVDCDSCQNVVFSKACVACTDCFGCYGLRNKQYHIFNQPYSKEEYAKKIEELNIASYGSFLEVRKMVYEHWQKYPQRYMHGLQNANVSGDYISGSKNAQHCFRVIGVEDSKFCQNILSGPIRDCYDYSNWGENAELMYEDVVCGLGASSIRFSTQIYPNVKNIEYSVFCSNSSNLFGCVSLRNKEYCILNKQYSKNEYEELVKKIKEHMNTLPYKNSIGETYLYGEYLPEELSYFPYEASAAHEFFPLNEQEAKAKGCNWYVTAKQSPVVTLKARDLPDAIKETSNEILGAIIECAHAGKCADECTTAYRVIQQEFEFCQRMGIPLPRLCTNCRHYERLELRNRPEFWSRTCACNGEVANKYTNTTPHFHGEARCPNTFQTSYSPDRPEIVYCEQCYNAEVV